MVQSIYGDIPGSGKSQAAVKPVSGMFQHRDDSKATYVLGVRYAEGNGVSQDYLKAAELYRKAADRGYAPAQYSLAYLYENGLGVTQDLAEALSWYRKAAEQG